MIVVLLLVLMSRADSDFCYDDPQCGEFSSWSPNNSYSWGDSYPSCHPILEKLHSPINLDVGATSDASLDSLRLEGFEETPPGPWTLLNDGHSVVLRFGGGMSVSGGGLPGEYHTLQAHFHWGGPASNGSEHTLDGRRFPMEMHVVSLKSVHPNVSVALDDPTGLAVLAFFIDVVYGENVHFSRISEKLSSVEFKGQVTHVESFPLLNLLPKVNMSQYYRYYGSLTTPPCSQAVVWTVYEVPVQISWTQMSRFTSRIFSSHQDSPQLLLRNNFRFLHPSSRGRVSASRDARVLVPAGGPRAALTRGFLPLVLAAAEMTRR